MSCYILTFVTFCNKSVWWPFDWTQTCSNTAHCCANYRVLSDCILRFCVSTVQHSGMNQNKILKTLTFTTSTCRNHPPQPPASTITVRSNVDESDHPTPSSTPPPLLKCRRWRVTSALDFLCDILRFYWTNVCEADRLLCAILLSPIVAVNR